MISKKIPNGVSEIVNDSAVVSKIGFEFLLNGATPRETFLELGYCEDELRAMGVAYEETLSQWENPEPFKGLWERVEFRTTLRFGFKLLKKIPLPVGADYPCCHCGMIFIIPDMVYSFSNIKLFYQLNGYVCPYCNVRQMAGTVIYQVWLLGGLSKMKFAARRNMLVVHDI